MRAIRGLTVVALVLLNVGTADAQASRGFKDSWFWGLKSGVQMYQVVDNGVAKSPLALMGGADWLITRSSGGLYLSFDHSFITADSVFVSDSLSPLDTVPRVVRMRGMRRFTVAGMLFPMQSYRLHPYMGFGVAFATIAQLDPQPHPGTTSLYRNGTQEKLVLSTIDAFKSTASPVVMIGAQLHLPLASLFGQITTTPSNNNFFLFSGSGWRTTFEAGLRYNAGTSIDRVR